VIKLSDYVMQYVAGLGVKHVFLLPGGGCMHLVDSLGRNQKLEYVCNLNEQAVSIAVEAYGQFTNNLGVGLVTTGPGGTNAVTGVAAAWVDSTPCLILSGQVKRSDLIGNSGLRQLGMQEIDIISIVKSITKYAITVLDPQEIRYHLEKAVYLAQNGKPGPVWLDLPLDVQAAMIDSESLAGFDPEASVENLDKISPLVQRTIELLNRSQRPCLLVGNGVRLGKAEKEFEELIRLLNIPVLTTWKAMDFLDENDSLFFGRPGSLGQRGANFIQQNADFLLVLGARLDFGQTGYNHGHFAPHASKVVVEIDQSELNKLKMPLEEPGSIDVKSFINKLLDAKAQIGQPDCSEWLAYCLGMKNRYPVILPEYYNESEYINPYVLIDLLSKYLDEKAVVVPGSSGMCSEVTCQAFKVKKGQRILNNQGFGAMGFGLPASLAVCLASGRKNTVSINGDGGFQLNIQELETVARLQLPVKYFILNNNGFGAITNTQRAYFSSFYVASEPGSGLTLPDICKLASTYGIPAFRFNKHQVLEKNLKDILAMDGPVICDIMLDPLQTASPRLSSMKMPDGTMSSKPLEDLWPFLEREEFERNMLK